MQMYYFLHIKEKIVPLHTLYVKTSQMKKLFFSLLALAAFCSVHSQNYVTPEEKWNYEEISGNNYHGFSFHKNWAVDFIVENQEGRYTPTDLDIAKAERLIQKKIAYVNRNHENQEGRCPIIDEHMHRYERQYVGFVDLNGAHIIWVNFLWDDTPQAMLKKDIVRTSGGCGKYWHIKCNLDTEKVYGLEVNESGDVKYVPRRPNKGPRISKPKRDYNPQRIRKTGIIHSDAEKRF